MQEKKASHRRPAKQKPSAVAGPQPLAIVLDLEAQGGHRLTSITTGNAIAA